MDSTEAKLKKLNGLIDTTDVNDWENRFLKSVVPVGLARCAQGKTPMFTDKQQEVLDRIYEQHFA